MLKINGIVIKSSDDLLNREPIYVTRRAATSGTAESEFGPFYGRETKNRFHRPVCKYIRPYLKWPGTIRFESHAEAKEAGRKPCMTCKA